MVVGGRRQPEVGFAVLPEATSCATALDRHAAVCRPPGTASGSTMIAPYRPISTCRSPCVPL